MLSSPAQRREITFYHSLYTVTVIIQKLLKLNIMGTTFLHRLVSSLTTTEVQMSITAHCTLWGLLKNILCCYIVSWVVPQSNTNKGSELFKNGWPARKLSLLGSLLIVEASRGSIAEMPSVTYCTQDPTTRTLHPLATSAT